VERKDEIIRIFAREIRQILQRAEADFDRVQEIRLRVGAPLLIVYKNREYYVSRSGSLHIGGRDVHVVTRDELRETMEIPILFVSARTSDDDQIAALSIGGDDYIQKPYSLSVLLAKVKAVLKRCKIREPEKYEDSRLTVDLQAKQVFVRGKPVRLTALEFKLLAYLIQNEGRVLSKQELFEKVWKDKFTGDGTLNVHIRKIREAIEENPGSPEYILTVWGDGYKFVGRRP